MGGHAAEPSMAVLLADDRPALDRSFKRALAEDDGIRVVAHAQTPGEALELMETCRPEVVVVDVSSDAMDGIELTRVILSAAPATAVLALVDAHTAADIRAATEAGATGYLTDDLPADFVPVLVRLAGCSR